MLNGPFSSKPQELVTEPEVFVPHPVVNLDFGKDRSDLFDDSLDDDSEEVVSILIFF